MKMPKLLSGAIEAIVGKKEPEGTPIQGKVKSMPVPETQAQIDWYMAENERYVGMVESIDLKLKKIPYLPPNDPIRKAEKELRQKRLRFIAHHILIVMALHGNPHEKAKTVEERNQIVRDTMDKQ